MRVRELIEILSKANPESTVLFLKNCTDSDESDEISRVLVPTAPWTHETARYRSRGSYEVQRYPGAPRKGFEGSGVEIVYSEERVVFLSNEPTNLSAFGVNFQRA